MELTVTQVDKDEKKSEIYRIRNERGDNPIDEALIKRNRIYYYQSLNFTSKTWIVWKKWRNLLNTL